jgi:SAM-dependent methyltransferase
MITFMQLLRRFFRGGRRIAIHHFCRAEYKTLGQPAPLRIARIASFDEYCTHAQSMAGEYESRNIAEQSLREAREVFSVPGFCFVCGRPVSFWADYTHGFTADGQLVPNWRECLICPGCRLNNRMRAAVHLFRELCRPRTDCILYVTEQTTPLYQWLKGTFTNVVGSEYLGSDSSDGFKSTKGIRHEDLTRLSFSDGQFDFVLCFDVFEHIPDYRKAFRECRRVLKKAGVLFFSIPFELHSAQNIIRARILPDGTTNHLLPPEYHGDPLRKSGCLCFRHFGWECLDELKAAGFSDAAGYLYWSREYGYLGGEQLLFLSRV